MHEVCISRCTARRLPSQSDVSSADLAITADLDLVCSSEIWYSVSSTDGHMNDGLQVRKVYQFKEYGFWGTCNVLPAGPLSPFIHKRLHSIVSA